MRLSVAVAPFVASLVASAVASCARPPREPLSNSWVGLSVERRAKLAPVVFHGLAVETYPPLTPEAPPSGFDYVAQFWLISVYKSARELAAFFGTGPPVNGVYDIRDRRVNVSGFYRPNATSTPHCWTPVTSQKYYVIFAEIVNGELRAKDDGSRGATADWTEQNEGRVWKGVVSAMLPNYECPPSFDGVDNPLDFQLFKPAKGYKSNVKRNPSQAGEEAISCIEELSRKLHSKNSASRERSGSVPVRSVKELEDAMSHPTWLTESNKKKVNEPSGDRNQRIFTAPSAPDGQSSPRADDDQKEHIKEVINKFQTLRLKPITDNRITKFVFTNDVDLATSRTVQEHNREVAAAFTDFNKKLEETLNIRGGKKGVSQERPDANKEPGGSDSSFNDVVNFLDRNIHKLKDEVSHKQVCRKHKSHSKDDDYEMEEAEPQDRPFGGVKRFNELARTRDGLENILLGLDRRGPFRRQIVRKFEKIP